MSTHHQRRASKERFWRRTLRQWRASDLTVREFCGQEGLSEPNFYAWRRKLEVRDAVRFVPVQVTSPANPPMATADDTGALELVMSTGRRLRIGPGFDGPTLQRLLALLEEGRL